MSEPITILLIDDHRVVRQGVRAFLSTQPDLLVVGEAESGAQGVELAARFVPDVALMDLVMPGMDGVEATRQLKRVSPRTQIIVLTSYHDDEHIFPALQAGALSYLLKDIGVDALAEAVRDPGSRYAVAQRQLFAESFDLTETPSSVRAARVVARVAGLDLAAPVAPATRRLVNA